MIFIMQRKYFQNLCEFLLWAHRISHISFKCINRWQSNKIEIKSMEIEKKLETIFLTTVPSSR